MKITAGDLTDVVFDAFNRGISMGRAQKEVETRDSIQALVSENSALKNEADKYKTRLDVKVQTDCFLQVRAEQIRVVKGIWDHPMDSDSKRELLNSLCLSDLLQEAIK